MGARFIKTTIENIDSISNLNVKDDTIFFFDYQIEDESFTFKVYCPTREDYEISIAVVDKALNLNCNLIVRDNWIFYTGDGVEYSNSKSILVLSVSEFKKNIHEKRKF